MQYEKDLQVEQFQCDMHDQLTMGAILRQVQQVSTDHCDSMGITFDTFRRSNTAFVLAKVSVECPAPIPVGQRLHIVTRPSWPVRAVYHRFTTMNAPDGHELCSIDARWVLIDTLERKILRTPPEALHFPFLDEVGRTHAIAITKAKELEPLGGFAATYSRTDRNGHLNNTCYADCICDALPLDLVAHNPIRRLVIYYHKELRLGESMELYRAQTDERTWYICGKKEGSKCFEASVTL